MYLVRLVRTHICDFLFMACGQNPMSYRSYLWLREKYWWSARHIIYGFRKHSTDDEICIVIVHDELVGIIINKTDKTTIITIPH